jgi:hypothetical protein
VVFLKFPPFSGKNRPPVSTFGSKGIPYDSKRILFDVKRSPCGPKRILFDLKRILCGLKRMLYGPWGRENAVTGGEFAQNTC